ncbi:MAG TPA: nucleotidyltransferase family protein [Candidatus Nanopelagicales bacterium]|nr:nucleotidyltransferase family protein [Candidatus Nanopelagicales bacterium]
MGTRLAALQSQRDAIYEIAGRHGVRSISVFGSVARGDDRPESDVDFLVQFEPGASLVNLMALEDDLEALLGHAVDVVSAGGLKVRDEHIRREAIPV